MMRRPGIFSLCLITLLLVNPAYAGDFQVTRASTIAPYLVQGEAAAPKVGNLIAPNMVMTFNDDIITVSQLLPGGARKTILTGEAFGVRVKKEENDELRIRGFCYFNGGEKLPELLGEDGKLTDVITTKDGRSLEGTIDSVLPDRIMLIENHATKEIQVRQIQSVVSSHIYTFTARMFAVQGGRVEDPPALKSRIIRLELDQTRDEFMTVVGRKRLEAAVSTKEYSKKQKALLVGASIFATAAAIALPIALAVPLAGREKKEPPSTHRDAIVDIER